MTSDLLRAVEKLQLATNVHISDKDECIGATFSSKRPKDRNKGNTQALKKGLDKDYLTPRTSFDGRWLDKVQQCVTQSRRVEFC